MSTKRGRYGNPAKRRPIGDLYRAAQPSGIADPRTLGGSITGPGGPHDRDAVVVDMTDCVLMDHVDVCTVAGFYQGVQAGERIFMTLGGRVNKTSRHVQVGFMFGSDGAAGLITELLALADRHGPELLDDVTRRLTVMYQEKHVDLAWLRAAIDTAMETGVEVEHELAAVAQQVERTRGRGEDAGSNPAGGSDVPM